MNRFLFFVILTFSLSCQNNDTTSNEISLWPEIEPYNSDFLKVSNIHEIYYEQSGNPKGKSVFVIHGGPGFGSSPSYRRFFNPDKFHIVLHDQRGAGRSKPKAELKNNTIQNLIEDIERLRKELDLDKIILFGGSWGSTLSLAYAETYPDNVEALILRGIFLPSKKDEENYIVNTIPKFFPIMYDKLMETYPDSMLPINSKKIFQLLQTTDGKNYAKMQDAYEYKACFLYKSNDGLYEYYDSEENLKNTYASVLVQYHYLSNGCFLDEGQLLRDAYKIEDIPIVIVNGRYDIICPPFDAYQLHKKLPKSKLIIAEKAGHAISERSIERELLLAMREFE